jgi:hypothetical protein
MISGHNLPEIDNLKRCLQSLAMLDSILSLEWEFRYYSFDCNWDNNTALATIRNGSGDRIFFVFNCSGCLIKGFSHESSMSPFYSGNYSVWPGVLEKVHINFRKYLQEASLIPEETTFCIWRNYSDNSWQSGEIIYPDTEDPDGSIKLLSLLFCNPAQYQNWAMEYYEVNIEIESVSSIFSHKLLSEDIVYNINSQASIDMISNDIQEIGYPTL